MAAATLASPLAFAQATGWYGGASVGGSAATIAEDRITRGLLGQGLVTNGFSERDRDVGFKLFGGYQINRNFGVELGWFDMGEMGYTATTTPPGSLQGDVTVRGLNLDLVGTLPLTERLSLLGRLGVAHVHTRGRFAATGAVTNPYGATRTSERDTGLKLGVGLAWKLTDAWDLRGEFERLRIRDTVGNRGHVDMLSVGVVYRFGGGPAPGAAAPVAAAPAWVAPAPPAPPAPPRRPRRPRHRHRHRHRHRPRPRRHRRRQPR
ncbi:outer membrane protein and related peptidoglycan-associated (lipo)protein [Serpentinimonas raichei]|uniref:Outer membrane protein and related peptidoglycan-associated (Lipo)protein n=2 Tax=Serpentinimonas raichei TaxID=1458425 RepID=A0A060NFP9_9BURK|nr:outer membrane protein and related peptidoglycan-associated (lipo)protein [Serpentinimonas raichei]